MFSHGIELTDHQVASLVEADKLEARQLKGKIGEDRRRAISIRRAVEQTCAAKADELATMRNIAGRAALAASLGQGLLAAGGYARVPRGDGLLKLADLGRLSAAEAKACWMYRQLHVSEEGTTAKLTAAIDGLPKASGGDIALSATVRHHETTTLAYLVQVVRSKVGDEALMILNAVARDGLLLRSVTGGGKAWERGLGRLKQAAAVVATHLAD